MGNTPGVGVGVGIGLGLGLAAGAAALIQDAGPKTGEEGMATQYQCNTEDIDESSAEELHDATSYVKENVMLIQVPVVDVDESSAEELRDATSYVKENAMLIQVPVVGTTKTFWRLSDEATRISRKLALILRSHHSVYKYLTAPLQVSNVWIGSTGNAKLRGVSFTSKGFFSIERVRDDYRHLSRVLELLITISGGDLNKLPPDYKDFLLLLRRKNLTREDEFLIVNNAALLPMKNRTEAFLMLHDRIVNYLGQKNQAKRKKILSNLPYKNGWLDTATANAKINQWVVNVQNEYRRTSHDLLRLNRNVRSHLHQYNHDDNIEEILYCEWPMLLIVMENMLHLEGELQDTGIHNKFG